MLHLLLLMHCRRRWHERTTVLAKDGPFMATEVHCGINGYFLCSQKGPYSSIRDKLAFLFPGYSMLELEQEYCTLED